MPLDTDVYTAVDLDDIDEVKYSIEQGKDVNQDSFMQVGEKPLMKACAKGNYDIVVMLLAAGAEVGPLDFFSRNAFENAAAVGSVAIMKELVKACADPHHVDFWRWNALHWAATGGYLEAVQYLLSLDVDPTLMSNEEKTPAQQARGEGYAEVADLLEAAAEARSFRDSNT